MKTYPLSPIDHVFTGAGSYPIEFVFAFKDRIDQARLQSSLEETLVHFPPLRSKLIQLSDTALGFEPTQDGLVLDITGSPSTFEESEDFSQFLESVHSVAGEPLTKIRLTQTPNGSVLGVSISHALADGFSYFHFLSCWARISRGKPITPPACQREFLLPEVTGKEPVTPEHVLNRCGIFWHEKRQTLSRQQIRWERQLLSQVTLNQLLSEAQAEHEARLTHNDVLTAYLWKNYVPRWSRRSAPPTAYASVPVDFRRVLDGLPDTYFGCAVLLAVASIDLERLESASLGELARLVREAVNRISEEAVWDSLETLESIRQERGLAVLEELHVVPPNNGLLVTNLSRIPLQDLDFGTGPPTGFQILTPAQRGAVILPAEDGVDIRVYHPSGSG
ncbi:MAG: acyltransferase [Candidatus Neomarinimicrobiota bacterium]